MELLLSTSANYALRAAACLSAADRGRSVPARELFDATHVPPAYLSKVLRRLVSAGILVATKGHHGGFRLARPAAQIRFLDVIEAMDDEPGLRRCQFGYAECSPEEPCPLHPFLLELDQRLRQWAEERTLADIDCAAYLADPLRRPIARARIARP